MKLLTVVGARPQFIKCAIVSRAIQLLRPDVTEILVHTGQHYDQNMSGAFFTELQIPTPSYNLGIGGGSHARNTGRMLEHLEHVILREAPHLVLVYGDTDSTAAAALCAAKLHVPVAHVEAGLRSYNRKMPEEINRIIADHLSDLLFAPTAGAQATLLTEGLHSSRVHVVGDVMYDAALIYRQHAREPNWFRDWQVGVGDFALCTIHRAENTDDPARLQSIFAGLAMSARPIVLPLHPRTKARLSEYKIALPENVHVVDPAPYLEMTWLEVNSSFVITDSGGVQKEAFFHGKPCITLRAETEWTELVAGGFNTLVDTDPSRIASLLNAAPVAALDFTQPLYGDGKAGEGIAALLPG